MLRWRCHPHHAGIFSVSLSSLQWCPLYPCCTGVVAVAALVSLPSLHWCCFRSCAGVVALIVLASSPLASLPLLCWRFYRCCSGAVNVFALVSLLLVYRCACGHPLLREADNVVMMVGELTANVHVCWQHRGGEEGITMVNFSLPLPSSLLIPPHSC